MPLPVWVRWILAALGVALSALGILLIRIGQSMGVRFLAGIVGVALALIMLAMAARGRVSPRVWALLDGIVGLSG